MPAWCSAPGAEACAAFVASSRVGFDARVPAAIANKTAAVALSGAMVNVVAQLDVDVRLPRLPNDFRTTSENSAGCTTIHRTGLAWSALLSTTTVETSIEDNTETQSRRRIKTRQCYQITDAIMHLDYPSKTPIVRNGSTSRDKISISELS